MLTGVKGLDGKSQRKSKDSARPERKEILELDLRRKEIQGLVD